MHRGSGFNCFCKTDRTPLCSRQRVCQNRDFSPIQGTTSSFRDLSLTDTLAGMTAKQKANSRGYKTLNPLEISFPILRSNLIHF